MKKIKITHQEELTGTIRISGAKNAAVALIPAAILSDEEVTLCNVPEITDIDSLEKILDFLNVKYKRATETMVIDASNLNNKEIPEEIAKQLRASYYFMGALLGRFKKVEMYFPGGCNIGARPINIHLEGFKKLGATITEKDDRYTIEAEHLKGANIYLNIASVGATINLMLAAVLAEGITTIENAAKEPEIINVATLLNNMGANIKGAGTGIIKIKGVEKLGTGFVEIIPDRIEAGTYIILGSLCGNGLKIDNIIPNHLEALISKLQEVNANIEIGDDYIECNNNNNQLVATDIVTNYFPGFATDLQQPFSVLLTQCEGRSIIRETIYENRFMHVPYLNDMGANITTNSQVAIIDGKTSLHGEIVKATDLRAGAALVIAGLIAEGETIIESAEHILRGYDQIVEKLTNVGAKIEIE